MLAHTLYPTSKGDVRAEVLRLEKRRHRYIGFSRAICVLKTEPFLKPPMFYVDFGSTWLRRRWRYGSGDIWSTLVALNLTAAQRRSWEWKRIRHHLQGDIDPQLVQLRFLVIVTLVCCIYWVENADMAGQHCELHQSGCMTHQRTQRCSL